MLGRLFGWKPFVITACLLSAASNSVAQTSVVDWSQWRGPARDGVADSRAWGTTVAENQLQELWRVELGPSYSGPIAVGERVYSTETRDQKTEVVSAYDRNSGKKLWETQWNGAMKVPFFANRNGSWIRSTPAYDEGRLFVAGMRDVLVCLDAGNGAVIWKFDFPARTGAKNPAFGCVCSPLVDGEFIFIQAGGAFYKMRKSDGSVVWKTADDGGGMFGSAFSSPVLTELSGKRQLVVQSRSSLMGVDPANGDVLWQQKIPAFRGMNILTPTVYHNSVFTSSYGGKSFLWEVSRNNGAWAVSEKWQTKAQGYMSSPVVIGRYLYIHLRNRRFGCIDLDTGEEKWRSIPYGEYASLVAGKDSILALDQRGELLVLSANPQKFEITSQRHISDAETWGHLAVRENQIFVRELNALAAYEWRTAAADESPP